MGFNFQEIMNSRNKNTSESQEKKPEQNTNCAQNILEHFYEQVRDLPARQDLKKMLKKCIYGIFTSQKIDAEISFLSEVRSFLNKVRENDMYYIELLELLDQIYLLAVDRQIENQIKPCQIEVNVDLLNEFCPIDPQQRQERLSHRHSNEENNNQSSQNGDQSGIYIFSDEGEEYVIEDDIDNQDEVEEFEEDENETILPLEIPQQIYLQQQLNEYAEDNDIVQLHQQEQQIFSNYYQDEYEALRQMHLRSMQENLIRNYSNNEDKFGVIAEVEAEHQEE